MRNLLFMMFLLLMGISTSTVANWNCYQNHPNFGVIKHLDGLSSTARENKEWKHLRYISYQIDYVNTKIEKDCNKPRVIKAVQHNQCFNLPTGKKFCEDDLTHSEDTIQSLVARKRDYINYLNNLNQEHGLPEFTLPVVALIESVFGTLTKGSGRYGTFQLGKREWIKYGERKYSPHNKYANARATVKLSKDYSKIVSGRGKPDTIYNFYNNHQQGTGGSIWLNKVLNGERITSKQRYSLTQGLCNNLPDNVKEGLCYRYYYKGKKHWGVNKAFNISHLAKTHQLYWGLAIYHYKNRIEASL